MTEKRIPRPRDPLALAKLIDDIATGPFRHPFLSLLAASSAP